MLRTTTASIARPLRSAANVTARRGYASHGPSYNAPSGYIFGEKVRRFTDASGKRYEQDYGHRKDILLRREGKSSVCGRIAIGRGNTTENRLKVCSETGLE